MSPRFNYQARTRSGRNTEGSVQANSRVEVARQLREEGYFVTRIEETAAGSGGLFSLDIDLDNIKFWNSGFNTAELARFSQQLSVLIQAGIPLVESLEIMEKQAQQKHVSEMLAEVVGSVEAGETFSDALEDHPDYFPPLFVHLIKAGETGGVLDSVLNQLVEYYKRRDKINKQVRASLYYPAVIVLVGIVAVFILTTFVLPVLLDMLLQFGGEQLPLPTRILVGLSNFMQSYWWVVAGVVVLAVMLIRSYFKTPSGKRNRDRYILKIPVIGDLIRKIVISRFASTLALLLSSGVNIINALPVLKDVVGNEVFADILADARERVREGVALSQPLDKSGEFPPIVIQMVMVGEETGNMEEMLNRLSEYYDIEVENAIEGGISLIEPALIIVMAVVVGGIVLSIILPLFEVYQQI